MAEVSIRANVVGFEDAGAKLNVLTRQLNEVAYTDQQWAQVLQNLNKIKDENLAKIAARNAATERLKAHTADLVRQFQEQERQEALANSTAVKTVRGIENLVNSYAARVLSVAAVISITKKSIDAMTEAATVDAKLAGALKVTGNTAGFTSQQLQEYAQSLSRSTKFGDEAIKNSMAVLTTFRSIGGDTFKEVIELSADLASLWGRDLTTEVQKLGRALEDPIRGVRLLRTEGVVLTDTQIKLIKTLQEGGDLLGAQRVLLDAVKDSVKGLAREMNTGIVKAMNDLSKQWNETLEVIGNSVVGEGAFVVLTSSLKAIKLIFEDLPAAIASMGVAIFSVIPVVGDKLAELAAKALDARKKIQEDSSALSRVALGERERERLIEERNVVAEIATLQKSVDAQAIKMKAQQEAAKKATAFKLKEAEEERDIQRQRAENSVRDGEAHLELVQDILQEQLKSVDLGAKEESRIETQLSQTKRQIRERDKQSAQDLLRSEQMVLRQQAEGIKEVDQVQRQAAEATVGYANRRIAEIRRTARTYDEERAGIQGVIEELENSGEAGIVAAQKIRDANKGAFDQSAKDAERLRGIWGESTFDMIRVFGTFHQAVGSTFADILRGTEGVGSGMSRIWKAAVDSVINELGRLLANDFFKLILGQGPGGILSGGGGTGLLGGLLGGILGGASGGAGAGGGSSGGGIGGLFSGLGSLVSGIPGIGSALGSIFGGFAPAAGGIIGSLGSVLGPIGAAFSIGSALGLFGGTKTSAVGTGYNYAGNWSFDSGLNITATGLTNVGPHPLSGQDVHRRNLGELINDVVAQIVGAQDTAALRGLTVPIDFTTSGVGQDVQDQAYATIAGSIGSIVADRLGVELPNLSGLYQEVVARPYATGGEFMATSPSVFLAGEGGRPERVRVEPMTGGTGRGGSSVSVTINGLALMDNYSARKLAYEIARIHR